MVFFLSSKFQRVSTIKTSISLQNFNAILVFEQVINTEGACLSPLRRLLWARSRPFTHLFCWRAADWHASPAPPHLSFCCYWLGAGVYGDSPSRPQPHTWPPDRRPSARELARLHAERTLSCPSPARAAGPRPPLPQREPAPDSPRRQSSSNMPRSFLVKNHHGSRKWKHDKLKPTSQGEMLLFFHCLCPLRTKKLQRL